VRKFEICFCQRTTKCSEISQIVARVWNKNVGRGTQFCWRLLFASFYAASATKLGENSSVGKNQQIYKCKD
jgi:hypothetical protein